MPPAILKLIFYYFNRFNNIEIIIKVTINFLDSKTFSRKVSVISFFKGNFIKRSPNNINKAFKININYLLTLNNKYVA